MKNGQNSSYWKETKMHRSTRKRRPPVENSDCKCNLPIGFMHIH